VPTRVWGPRLTVAVLVAVLIVYFGLLGVRGFLLLTSGSVSLGLLGAGVLLLPLVGGVLVGLELRFGLATQRLGERLAAEGGLPADDLPRLPSGRPDQAAADSVFAVRRAETEAAPDDWRTWFRLGIAYDDAGDRRRARAALRQAVALST
jgi:hypothetical protein